ncbi:MAG: DNA polymerase III subunit alpha [Bacteroidota bacterium]
MFLNCHSYFSFQYGTLSISALFDEAKRHGVRKLVLTDINNTSGYIELLRIARERRVEWDLEVVVGIEFRREDRLQYIGIARNDEGFQELNRFLSRCNFNSQPVPVYAPVFDNAYVIYPMDHVPESLGSNEYVGIRPHQLNRIYRDYLEVPRAPGEGDHLVELPPQRVPLTKMVAWQPFTFSSDPQLSKQHFNIHRLLRAINQNTILSKLGADEQASPHELMMSQERFHWLFRQYPPLLDNAKAILEDCQLDLSLGTDKNKRYFFSSKQEDRAYLIAEATKGYEQCYGGRKTAVTDERFQREIDIIGKKNFESYYLISYDIVRHAREQGFEYVGRGSGANSMIAYCLGITNTDPIELDLYFERFLNPERSSPPDFDIDFSWRDRDHIYDYIFGKYDPNHVALLGTHTTYKGRSNLRELGKVFGLPKEEIDKIITYPNERPKDEIARLIFRYSELIQGMPAHISIHAGGVLITEQPIYQYTTVDLPPKGYPVAHFEMHNAEDMGIYKFDILSQRGLGHIKDTLQLITKNQSIEENINRFHDFKKDEKIQQLLEKGNTMGCFYVESPAMRMLLGKLECQDYITLVAASSIIRPGVARSGMMRAYIERHHAIREGQTYEAIHPKMDLLMSETYGVMVYQEDVIKVAHHFAGLTLSEADVLRRGMSGKYRSRKEFQKVRDQFFDNCESKGYPEAVINRVWFEIESFSGYSFSKGHSASYAVESYQSLYLKAHYPLEFMVGVINNFGGFYKTEFYFHEARMWGASIQAPCVNHSEYLTTIMGTSIYIGFIHLKDLQQKIAQTIHQERLQNGPFKNLDNFVRRIPIGLEQIRLLIRIGAFRFTGKNKKELLWQAQLYFGQKSAKTYFLDLFEEEPETYELPFLKQMPLEDAFDEMELLGFPLCDPYLLLDDNDLGSTMAGQLKAKLGRPVEMVGYLVTTKDTSTKDGKRMHFGTFYDKEGAVFDSVHFPPVAKQFPFRGRGFYRIRGKVVEDFSYPMLEATWMDKLAIKSKFGDAPVNVNPKVMTRW